MFSLSEIFGPLDTLLNNIPSGYSLTEMEVIQKITQRVFQNLLIHKIGGVQAIDKTISFDLSAEINCIEGGQLWILPLEMKTRKLPFHFDFDTIQDVKNSQGYDPIPYIVEALGDAMTADLDQALLSFMHSCADHFKMNTGFPVSVFRSYNNPTLPLCFMIEQEAIAIQRLTKHLPGNWCIVDTKMYDCLLREMPDFTSAPFNSSSANFWRVGTIKDKIAVYLDISDNPRPDILVGYKSTDDDSSVIYAPNILIRTDGKQWNPNTLETETHFKTKSGHHSPKYSLSFIEGHHEA